MYQLQTMMTEIDKIKTLRGELPLEVQDLEDEIAGLETRLQNYQADIKDLEASITEQKHKITESIALIERYKAQLDNVRNNREFDNLSKEIEFQGLEIEFSEKKIREFGDSIETKKKDIADLTEKALSERKNAVLIVPAMMKGSGQEESFIKHPDHCFDVGIAEEHALTFAGALGINGFHPIVNIYSTFLQRAYDELNHDCARLGSNMTLLIDRAGLVGSNGETHQGIFDPAFLRAMPGVCLSMPSNPQIAARLMDMSFEKGGIFAIRYSRKGLIKDELPTPDGRLTYLGMRTLNQPSSLRLAIVAVGPRSEEIAKSVKEYRIDAAVFDPVFLNPLPNGIVEALSRFDAVLIHDPYGVEAGFALPLVGALALSGYKGKIAVQAVPNEFIQADSIDAQEEKCGVSLSACLRKAAELLGKQPL